MSLFRRSSSRSTRTPVIPPRRTMRALERARAAAPTSESQHELYALATRL